MRNLILISNLYHSILLQNCVPQVDVSMCLLLVNFGNLPVNFGNLPVNFGNLPVNFGNLPVNFGNLLTLIFLFSTPS